MAIGSGQGGTDRLICSGDVIGPPIAGGGTGGDADDDYPKLNVIVWGGLVDTGGNVLGTWAPTPPTTNDFAVEAWICRNYPDSITTWQVAAAAAQGYGFTGWLAPSGPGGGAGGTGGFWFRGANFEAVFADDDRTAWTNQVGLTGTLPFGWSHVAVNFDRDGNMQMWINGVSQGTQDISGSSAISITTNCRPSALMCDVASAVVASGKIQPPYRIAGVAFHRSALLTAAQVQDSVDNITFQDLGASNSEGFFFRDTVLLRNNSSISGSTFDWKAPYDAEDSGADSFNVSDGQMATILGEYSNSIDTRMLQESTWTTRATGTTEKGARTPNIYGRANSYIDWYFSELSEGTWTFDTDAVFGSDPSWPPNRGVDDKGYA